MKQEINPQDTNRAQAFELWMKSPMPMVTLTKVTLPISFQFHHVQMDGGHGARFLDELQKTIKVFEYDCLTAFDEVVHYLGGAAHGGPGLLVAAASVEEVEDGILDLLVLGIIVAVGSIDDHPAVEAELGTVVPESGEGTPMGSFVIDGGAFAGD